MLHDVFEFVRTDFKNSGCPARVLFGEKFKAENAEPNRVVFVPRADGEYGTAVISAPLGTNTRAIMRRDAGCDLWIWGAASSNSLGEAQLAADYNVLNALINQTALSLYRACGLGRVLTILGGQHDVNALLVNRGLAYTMRIKVSIPIVDIDFPCGCIDENVYTWLTQDDVTAQVTVNAMTPVVPTGATLMSTMAFAVTKDT
jgi:hypothetical protein